MFVVVVVVTGVGVCQNDSIVCKSVCSKRPLSWVSVVVCGLVASFGLLLFAPFIIQIVQLLLSSIVIECVSMD